jgi:hypothetical protein
MYSTSTGVAVPRAISTGTWTSPDAGIKPGREAVSLEELSGLILRRQQLEGPHVTLPPKEALKGFSKGMLGWIGQREQGKARPELQCIEFAKH